MTAELILFIFLAIVAIISALGMLLSKNAVYAALYLVLNFFTIALFYLILAGPFIAMAQITVYAGAIMVLFLFVIMLLGAEKLGKSQTLAWQKPVAVILALILVAETAYIVFFRSPPSGTLATVSGDFGSPASVGDVLFNNYLLPFEVTSVLLLVAMIGAIILTRKEKPANTNPAPSEHTTTTE